MSDNPFASPNSSEESFVANADATGSLGLLQPLVKATFWSRLLSVSMILIGISFVLSIIGIVVGWLPIWAGISLWQHTNRLQEAQRSQDSRQLQDSIEKLATSIKVAAIFMLVMMGLYALYFLVILGYLIAGFLMYN